MTIPIRYRQFIVQFFSDDELEDLCFDYFPDVRRDFTQGMTKSQKTRLLVDHATRHGRLDHLAAALAQLRPEAYAEQLGEMPAIPSPTAAAERDPRQLFICHAYEDGEIAHRLAGDLRNEGWRVWIAPESISPGERWVDAINHGLQTSGAFLLVMTPAAVASRWVRDEMGYAIDQANRGQARLLVLDVEQADAPPLWTIRQHIPFGAYEEGLRMLLDALRPADHAGPPAITAATSSTAERERPIDRYSPLQRFSRPLLFAAGAALVVLAGLLIYRAIQGRGQRTEIPDNLSTTLNELARLNPTPAGTRSATLSGGITVEQRFVPAGTFGMGFDEGEPDERPAHKLEMGAFWIDRTEVTNAQYAACVAGGACTPPDSGRSFTRPDYYQAAEFASYPVLYVTWEQAGAFCAWAGGRLPTEAEWEKAVRGPEGLLDEWVGEAAVCEWANVDGCFGDTNKVGATASWGSPYGAVDMAGNVWEWVNDWYDEAYYAQSPPADPPGPTEGALKVIRGGGWTFDSVRHFNTVRRGMAPDTAANNIGFRCVYE